MGWERAGSIGEVEWGREGSIREVLGGEFEGSRGEGSIVVSGDG